MSYRKDVGDWGEKIASDYLISNGYQILEHNFYTRYGEIDIVASKDEDIIFVEVKTRTTEAFGKPEEAITRKKTENLINTALLYMQEHPECEDDWQIDIITIEGAYLSKSPRITHFQNAING